MGQARIDGAGAFRWVGALVAALIAAVASASPTVTLPVGESHDAWAPVLEVAGLEWTTNAAEADVAIDAVGDWWRLRAGTGSLLGGRATVVAAPRSDADRESIAFLAKALARELTFGDEPGPSSPRIPPPPPPPPVAVATVEPRAEAPAVRAAPVVEPVVDAPVAAEGIAVAAPNVVDPPAEAGTVAELEVEPPVPAEPPPEPAPAVAETEPSGAAAPPSTRPRGGAPGLTGIAGAGLRGGASSAWFGVAADALPGARVGVEVAAGFAAPHRLPVWAFDGIHERSSWSVDLSVAPRIAFGRAARIRPLVGVALHGFRQQRTPIDAVATPFLGVGGDWTWGRAARVGLVARATWDARPLTLVDSFGFTTEWPAVAWSVGVAGRFAGRGRSDRAGDDTRGAMPSGPP